MPKRPGLRLSISASEKIILALIGLVLIIVQHFLK